MANSSSAKKRIRQVERRTAANRSRMSRIRTYMKQVETAIDGGSKEAAQQAFQAAQPEMMRGVKVGLIHRNMVARKLSRLAARIKGMAA